MENRKVIIVEDEIIIALDMKASLTGLGYSVCGIFQSGEEACSYLFGHQIDLVILDIKLKGMIDGVETAKIIDKEFEIPFVIFSGTQTELAMEALGLRWYRGFIKKPYKIEGVKDCLSSIWIESSNNPGSFSIEYQMHCV